VAHNVIHHTYTNIPGVDSDLEPGPTMMFYPQEEKARPWHRFQHIYAWFLYCFVGFIWVYIKDFGQMGRPDPLTGKRATLADWAKVLGGKALHIGILLVAPLLVLDQPVWQTVVGYLLAIATGGFTLAIVFQLAHCIEGVQFPRIPGDANRMPEAWAEHQMRTTANFGKTPLATFICGGLDHQIEHHLMPRICHIHYRKLAPIVAQCAKEHGLPYVHNGSFFEAVGAHARTMKRLGRGDATEMSPVATTASAA
jgi:linoleoyl-CoA desaturase